MMTALFLEGLAFVVVLILIVRWFLKATERLTRSVAGLKRDHDAEFTGRLSAEAEMVKAEALLSALRAELTEANQTLAAYRMMDPSGSTSKPSDEP